MMVLYWAVVRRLEDDLGGGNCSFYGSIILSSGAIRKDVVIPSLYPCYPFRVLLHC